MKTYYLFPRYFRPLGFILAVPGLILGFLFLFYGVLIPDFGPPRFQGHEVFILIDNYTNELALTLIVVGLMFIAFAKLKKEDELTAQLRLNALYWAILVNYVLLTVVAMALNGNEVFIGFRHIRTRMLDYSAFVLLIVFLIRFYYLLHKSKDEYFIVPLRFLPYNPFNRISRWLVVPCICLFIPRLIYDLFYPDFFELKPLLVRFAFVSYFILPAILLIWMYSKERVEDEYINSLRLRAMQIAIYINCIVLLLGNFVFSGIKFLYFETAELSILPLIFVIIFQYSLYRLLRNTSEKNGQSLNIST